MLTANDSVYTLEMICFWIIFLISRSNCLPFNGEADRCFRLCTKCARCVASVLLSVTQKKCLTPTWQQRRNELVGSFSLLLYENGFGVLHLQEFQHKAISWSINMSVITIVADCKWQERELTYPTASSTRPAVWPSWAVIQISRDLTRLV